MKILLDMSSVLWTCLLAGKDSEGIEVQHGARKVWVNTCAYGYENVVNSINAALNQFNCVPMDMVMVFEGKDSKKRRTLIDTTYKANREGDKDSRPPEAYVQFNLLKDLIRSTYKNLGAIAVSQPFVEGDDVLGWFADNMEEDCVIKTGDGDLAVLNKVNKFGAKVQVLIGDELGKNKYGEFDVGLVSLYKGLVGDTTDNIKGCPGFGKTAWMNLNIAYGDDGCFELEQLINDGKRDEIAQIAKDNNCKLLNKIVDEWDAVRKSLRLSTIHPEWVNTVKQQLEWDAGMVRKLTDDERLKQWRAASRLVTATNYSEALAWVQEQLLTTSFVAFDIETSTPDESDDWLAAMGDPEGVDVMGSALTGYAITFGANHQYSIYVSVDHADTDNVSMSQARQLLELCFGHEIVIQRTAFELPVLYGAQDEDGSLWRDLWKQYGAGGMIPNVRDTLFEASYVDENIKLGLKFRSKHHLGYDQATYQETMTLEGKKGTLPKGGRLICEEDFGEHGIKESRIYKMRELSAKHVLSYGTDDTITTAALHNFYKLHMQLDHHYDVYLEVELDAAYLHARSFYDGVNISVAKCKELEKIDDVVYDDSWAILRKFLMENGWEGTVPPNYTPEITAKEIKQAYAIVMGLDGEPEEADEDEEGEAEPAVKDPFLSTRVRIPSKMVTMLEELGHGDFALRLQGCLDGHAKEFTAYVLASFTGEPKFKSSNKQMQVLLYEKMALPIRVRGKVTKTMKAKGIKEGNPKGDALAIAYALRDAPDNLKAVLEAIKLLQMVRTRRSFYYSKYPYFVHWKTGKVHSSHNQCATNTRRASSSKPNFQQLPKHPKIEGYESRFREVIVPHKKTAVVVSMDFAAQELRVIADYSKDKNMVACFVGDNKKDMHALTGAGILAKKNPALIATTLSAMQIVASLSEKDEQAYTAFEHLAETDAKVYKEFRALGKKCNFTTEFGAAAPKLAATMLVEESEAQVYIDAKERAFPEVVVWKEEVQDEAKSVGFVRTKKGAMRHLAALFNSPDSYIASKADRQAVNFKVQSSSAEMTKLAEGRMFKAELLDKLDCEYYGPVHDEVVWSVELEDLTEFLVIGHACMVQQYADMLIPVESSISFGVDFHRQVEIGNNPAPEAIASGLKQMETV